MTKSKLDSFLRFLYNHLFRVWEKMGFHVTPVHYYMPIPDTSSLEDVLWQNQSALTGIEINEKVQKELLANFNVFKGEYEHLPKMRTTNPTQYFIYNNSFDSVDGEILYCMIRYFKPKKIIEIGSGFSTILSAQAIQKNKMDNADDDCELEAIDPYPNEIIKTGFPGFSKLTSLRVQDIPLSSFEVLEENDILFIDSSHVIKIGSDVQYLYLEVLPRLKSGVIIHIHDIFLPAEYPKNLVLKEHIFWNEQYLLQAFLIFNDHFKILWSGSFMHLKNPDLLEAAFNSYNRDVQWPGSFWMQKTK